MSDLTETTDKPEEVVTKEITPEDIANMSEEEIEKFNPNNISNNSIEVNEPTENLEESQLQNNVEDSTSLDQTNTENEDQQVNEPENNTTLSAEEFKRLVTSPFRANNTEVKVDKPEDIIKFMQMGMNYQKKLGAIRPHLGALKSLEQNGLLDKDKINFMVELMQGKPEAVAQFLKEKNIDAYSLPDLEDKPYTPNNYIPTEQQLNFDEKVLELSEDEIGRRVLTDIKSWDSNSIDELYKNPHLLTTLKSHADNGLYKDTMSILVRESALGNIPPNISMIDAYDRIATQLLNEDGDKYTNNSFHTNVPKQQQRVVVGNNLQQPQQNVRQNFTKQQASIPNSMPTSKPNYIDPLMIANMTEEELAKYGSFEELVQSIQLKR